MREECKRNTNVQDRGIGGREVGNEEMEGRLRVKEGRGGVLEGRFKTCAGARRMISPTRFPLTEDPQGRDLKDEKIT